MPKAKPRVGKTAPAGNYSYPTADVPLRPDVGRAGAV